MNKNYFRILLFILLFSISLCSFSQNPVNKRATKQNIEQLSIYPNPVTNGKTVVFITTKQNLVKKVDVFNVLGKQVLSTFITGKTLNIANLSKGVYVLKITENANSENRKLVIK